MNIYDEHGKHMGGIKKPEPILQDGKWWEADKSVPISTPAPSPAPKVTDAPVFTNDTEYQLGRLCHSLGMEMDDSLTVTEDVIAFIRDLHKRANEERYSVEEIKNWLRTLPLEAYASMHLTEPQDGIKAVTERSAGK